MLKNNVERRDDSDNHLLFDSFAEILSSLDLSGFPCAGEDGKRPVCKWDPFKDRKPSERELLDWCRDYPTANLGLVTGRINNLTVIDIDDPLIEIDEAQETYGESKFIVSTPRGGFHLYYQFNPNIKTSVRKMPGTDFRSEGGYVIFPGSFRAGTDKRYEIFKGDYSDLKSLSETTFEVTADFKIGHKVSEGSRNTTLYDFVLKKASYLDAVALREEAHKYNSQRFSPPLPIREVDGVVANVERYKQEGRLFIHGCEANVLLGSDVFTLLKGHSLALVLWIFLQFNHAVRKTPFCVDQIKVGELLGYDHRKIRRAIAILLNLGLLSHVGHQNKAKLYRLPNRQKRSTDLVE